MKASQLSPELRKRLGITASRSKYNVSAKEKRTADGIAFDSRGEMRQYLELKKAVAGGAVQYFLRQVPFHLPGNTRYTVDFMVVYADDRIEYQDVKGHRTKEFIRAKKQVEALYPVEIREIPV